jgi:hypothetical protein
MFVFISKNCQANGFLVSHHDTVIIYKNADHLDSSENQSIVADFRFRRIHPVTGKPGKTSIEQSIMLFVAFFGHAMICLRL